MGGWSDKMKVILNSTQLKSKLVEVGVELGNNKQDIFTRDDLIFRLI